VTERRFHVRPEDAAGERLVLRADEAHHARRALRLAPGAPVVCFDGAGRVWRGRIAAYERDAALVDVDAALPVAPPPAPRLTLAQGLVKGDRMDEIVQKATELGAWRVVPLRADRSDVRLDAERAGRRAERWRRIAVESAKQCERAWLPEVAEPETLDDALAALDGPAVAFVERDGVPARPALDALGAPERLVVFVGPEGGWSERERAALARGGVPGLSLGANVLRAETAAIAALAVIAFALGRD
jgi:16S rRNA (uracil1498-N3)-methyltransferase